MPRPTSHFKFKPNTVSNKAYLNQICIFCWIYIKLFSLLNSSHPNMPDIISRFMNCLYPDFPSLVKIGSVVFVLFSRQSNQPKQNITFLAEVIAHSMVTLQDVQYRINYLSCNELCFKKNRYQKSNNILFSARRTFRMSYFCDINVTRTQLFYPAQPYLKETLRSMLSW